MDIFIMWILHIQLVWYSSLKRLRAVRTTHTTIEAASDRNVFMFVNHSKFYEKINVMFTQSNKRNYSSTGDPRTENETVNSFSPATSTKCGTHKRTDKHIVNSIVVHNVLQTRKYADRMENKPSHHRAIILRGFALYVIFGYYANFRTKYMHLIFI